MQFVLYPFLWRFAPLLHDDRHTSHAPILPVQALESLKHDRRKHRSEHIPFLGCPPPRVESIGRGSFICRCASAVPMRGRSAMIVGHILGDAWTVDRYIRRVRVECRARRQCRWVWVFVGMNREGGDSTSE